MYERGVATLVATLQEDGVCAPDSWVGIMYVFVVQVPHALKAFMSCILAHKMGLSCAPAQGAIAYRRLPQGKCSLGFVLAGSCSGT